MVPGQHISVRSRIIYDRCPYPASKPSNRQRSVQNLVSWMTFVVARLYVDVRRYRAFVAGTNRRLRIVIRLDKAISSFGKLVRDYNLGA